MTDITPNWETDVQTAADTILRHPEKISDGLEAELYALQEKLAQGQERNQPPAHVTRNTGTVPQ